MNRVQVGSRLRDIPEFALATDQMRNAFYHLMKPLTLSENEVQAAWYFYSRGYDLGYAACASEVKEFLS